MAQLEWNSDTMSYHGIWESGLQFEVDGDVFSESVSDRMKNNSESHEQATSEVAHCSNWDVDMQGVYNVH